MDDSALLASLGIIHPGRRKMADAFNEAFPEVTAVAGSRKRVFDERRTVGLMLGQALNRNDSCKSAVRRAQVEFGDKIASSTAAYCKARARVRDETIRTMSARLSREADGLCDSFGFKRVDALDGTTFLADDTDANRAEWPYASGQRPGCGFPLVGALVAHSLIGGGSEILVTAPWNAHDFRLYVQAAPKFHEGDLQIGDRAFCSFTAFALLCEAKADGIFRGKDWCNTPRPGDVSLGAGDRLTTWRKCWSKKSMTVPPERRAEFPDEIRIRIITAKIRARGFRDETIVIATSLLDPKKYPKEKILALYLRRWEIEVSFRDMKTTLRYEFIRSRTPKMVKKELEVLLLAYNLMRYVMARGGGGRNKPRLGIASTAAAVMSFLAVIQAVYKAGRSCARAFVRLVRAVSADKLPKRERKPYVRAVKRRPKPYPLLMKPRDQYAPEECV